MDKQKVVVLGAGRVGKVIAADLAQDFDVTSADMNRDALQALSARFGVKPRYADLADAEAVRGAVADADLVICAVPGFMGFQTLKAVIESGKDVVDISFFAEDAFELDALARERNVMAVVDCGVAPGIPDYLAGMHVGTMQVEDLEFMVGGLHLSRSGPEQYLPTFSPSDVWEEYTRPARFVKNDKLITMPPLSEPEILEFRIGGHELKLEAFNTDGLRTLIRTMHGRIPNMKEKTLRYPGHIAYIRHLQETREPWVPETWKPGDDDDEFTAVRITLRGSEDGIRKKISYNSLITYDKERGMSSMSRVTGYSCTGVARCVLGGAYKRTGISAPSDVGEAPGCMERIFAHLRARGILFERKDEPLQAG
jgi:lysine 6-dehydrogenase